MNNEIDFEVISLSLLRWYDAGHREMPWRAKPYEKPDAYHVWLSEIMLQQTTVAVVKGYFVEFIKRWPTVKDLAKADIDEIFTVWQGLGYYNRARNLHRCAKIISSDYGGVFPEEEITLLKLPGIGPYTAAAILSIAFDKKATVVDGNVERVISRLFRIEEPLPSSKPQIKKMAEKINPNHRCGDYSQAIMDLGATVCTPRNPKCSSCPVNLQCSARKAGLNGILPKKTPKKDKPRKYTVAYWMVTDDARLLLRRRPEKGIFGGMIEIPTSDWRENPWDLTEAIAIAPYPSDWKVIPVILHHTFSHFRLDVKILVGKISPEITDEQLVAIGDLPNIALPTLMRKIVDLVKKNTVRGKILNNFAA